MNEVPFNFGPPGGGDESDRADAASGGSPFDMAVLGAALEQLGSLLQSGGETDRGPVDWELARNIARQALFKAGDPVVSESQERQVRDAMHLADVWLNGSTQFPACSGEPEAWSRSKWLEVTLPAWQAVITPVAEEFSRTLQRMLPTPGGESSVDGPGEGIAGLPAIPGLPEHVAAELAGILGPLMGMAKSVGASMFGAQAGQGLAALAGEVLGAGDIGVPLTDDGLAALVPENLAAFGAGLGVPEDDVRLFAALREGAHQRLFAHVPWLRSKVAGAIEAYCSGIRVDHTRIEEAMGNFDPSNPDSIQQVVAGDVFETRDTEECRAALRRLETILALIEGWVDDVVRSAAEELLPSYDRLGEVLRRRRASGGPAEKTFATLVGLELRPRRLRDAARMWSHLREEAGIEGRDRLWEHPDLLPAADDFDDVDGFVMRAIGKA